jgi:lipopolysaccharide export system protein LptC
MRGLAALFPLLLAAASAGGSYWLSVISESDPLTSNPRLRHDPDYFAQNFVVKHYGAGGILERTVVGQWITHYPDTDTAEIIAPKMNWHGSPLGQASARRAWVDKGHDRVDLFDDVVLWRAGKTKGDPPMEITTSRMTLFPDAEQARTDAPVVIRQGQNVAHGVGLDANVREQRYGLGGRARATIAATDRPQPSP